jgi:hypothetical protein
MVKYREKLKNPSKYRGNFCPAIGNTGVISVRYQRPLCSVLVSNNTISRGVDHMSHDTEDVLSEILKNTNFALQVDESADITSKAQLLAFVRFENKGEMMENFCCCKELPETTKGQDTFNILYSYLESCGLSLSRGVGICTDGAPPPPPNDRLNKRLCYTCQRKKP